MKRILFFTIIVILIGFNSCHKDNDTTYNSIYNNVIIGTIKPLDYFPAFPGSYWVYNIDDSLKVADDYKKYIFNSNAYDESEDYDTIYFPKLLTKNVYNPGDSCSYVNGYSISKAQNSSYKDPAFKYILSETEGSTFIITAPWQNHQIIGKTINIDTSIIVGNTTYVSVLVTIELDMACSGQYPMDSCAYKREYYAKGVGLIKRESGGYIPNDNWTTDFELKEYYINN